MNIEKRKLIILGIATFVVFISMLFYIIVYTFPGNLDNNNTFFIIIPLILVVFMAFFIVRRYRDIKSGQPLEDERSRKVITMASSKAFYISLYWFLAISWFEALFADKLFNSQNLDASQTIGGGIAGMAIIFFICWLYYNKKENLI